MDHITDISNTLMEETDISNNCIIKHIVISGGGHYRTHNVWHIKRIT